MASTHNAERITKSDGAKIVKLDISENDLVAARKQHLANLKKQHEKSMADTVPLKDISDTLGTSSHVIKKLADKYKLPVYKMPRYEYDNRVMLSVNSIDAEKLIQYYYNP